MLGKVEKQVNAEGDYGVEASEIASPSECRKDKAKSMTVIAMFRRLSDNTCMMLT
jgi:hypothetical protein